MSGNYSAVYGPRDTKLGREVGVGYGKNLTRFVSIETVLLPWKPGNSLMATIFG